MKTTLKPWQITLLSIFTIMFAVILSIFCLKADTIDEETGEILTDNWELGIVFYDSTVDNGKTPLTEINWDASDGSYKAGTPRVITVQINYKNNSAVTTYQPGELVISIPNLIYGYKSGWPDYTVYGNYDVNWDATAIVGANDSTHTNYDWDFISGTTPTRTQEVYKFTNAKIIEEKANFEGSIQIQYSITPNSESPESYVSECIHKFNTTLQATLEYLPVYSPNWPNNYPNNMTEDKYFWEYKYDGAKEIIITFDNNSKTEQNIDYIRLYDKKGNLVHTLSGTSFAGQSYTVTGDYVKITMRSDGNATYSGFLATFTPNKQFSLNTNQLSFNYSRTYIHPWKKPTYTFTKTASKISALDGLSTGLPETDKVSDYIWVKYTFKTNAFSNGNSNYPYIKTNQVLFKDEFPEECIVYDENINLLSSENNNIYTVSDSETSYSNSAYGYVYSASLIVGYPRTIYNDLTGNLEITNYADMYAIYGDSSEEIYQYTDDVSINLANFEFTYTGNLYGIGKAIYDSKNNPLYYESITGLDPILNNSTKFYLAPRIVYSGKPMDVKIGDDLLYITGNDNNYHKLQEEEYYFSLVSTPCWFVNGHGNKIPAGKYNMELWVKSANDSEYILYDSFTNNCNDSRGYGKIWRFTEEQKICAYYFLIKDLEESIKMPYEGFFNTVTINNAQNIANSGIIYNFSYLQVYVDGILQNEPPLDSYSNFITQEEIATYDQTVYKTYMQRACAKVNYNKYEIKEPNHTMHITKTMSTVAQDAEKEIFTGKSIITIYNTNDNDVVWTEHEAITYSNRIDNSKKLSGYELYDLLPEGMILTSTSEDIINTIVPRSFSGHNAYYVYDKTGKKLSYDEITQLYRDNTTIDIIENWNNTNRTYLHITINLENNPIVIMYDFSDLKVLELSYNYSVSYDSFIEFGNVWENHIYGEFYNRVLDKTYFMIKSPINDNGLNDSNENDINENNVTEEDISFAKASTTITSVVSTHQDVTTYVKTDQSNYSTGIVDTSNSSEYEYKLRVRTGVADVTNLVIYTSIEEAQPNRTRWYGEFLGVDTTYAENKGYTVKVWYSPNKTVGTLAEDTSWLEYDEATVDKSKVKSLAFQYLVETDDTTGTSIDTIDSAVLPANSLTYVLIKMKSPADENETRLARMDCWTEWNALDDYDRPVDFITGINSNVVKVALPNSVKTDDTPSISLNFIKEITGSDEDFNNLLLNKADEQIFAIRLTSLTANEDGSYNQITGLLSSTQGLSITNIPIGTYLLEELDDNYFNFVEFSENNEEEIVINGVTFEKTDQGYIITVSEDLSETIEFNIKVANEIENERFYEDKSSKENLFLKNKIEENPEI